MIDPYFFDRLMHAFTTTNSTPLSHASGPGAPDQSAPVSPGEAPTSRVVREAEAVVAEVLRRNYSTPSSTSQADGHV